MEKKRRDELRARIKEQRQSKPDIGIGIPDSLSGTPNTSQSQDLSELKADIPTNNVEELKLAIEEEPKHVIGEPKHVIEEPKNVIEEPKHVIGEPKHVIEEPKHVIEEPKHVIEEPKPAVSMSSTPEVTPEPVPVVEEPKPIVEEPTTIVPKPVIEEPKVVIEKPKPNIPATPVHAPHVDPFTTPKPSEDLQQLLLRQQQLEAEKKSFEAEQLAKLKDNGFGADPLKVKEQQTQQRQELLVAQQKEQLDQQQRLLQLREQQAQLKQAQVRSPSTAARSSTPSKTLDEFLFTDVMNDAQRGELMNLQKKAKFEEIYSKSFNERDLEEIRNKMVKQFRDVLHEYESLMMNYSGNPLNIYIHICCYRT